MRRLRNTLYVLTQGSYLSKEGETVLLRLGEETKLRVPIHNLEGIICFGQVSCSPFLLGLCAEKGVGVSFLTERGRFMARMQGPVSGNVLLRKAQYRWSDDPEKSAFIARSVVAGKIANSRTALLRGAREYDVPEVSLALGEQARRLGHLLETLEKEQPLETLRGIEGEAGKAYFSVFDHFIVAQKKDFVFTGRNRRPPMDRVNALLSFVYTLLVHDLRSALEGVGLDPGVGFLHRDRPGRPSLALDMMEEFRPMLADRLVLTLINRQQVKPKGFTQTESGAVTMDEDTRKEVLTAWQKRKQEEIEHPFLGEKIPLGLLPHAQAMLMARFLKEDLDGYPPFRWK